MSVAIRGLSHIVLPVADLDAALAIARTRHAQRLERALSVGQGSGLEMDDA